MPPKPLSTYRRQTLGQKWSSRQISLQEYCIYCTTNRIIYAPLCISILSCQTMYGNEIKCKITLQQGHPSSHTQYHNQHH